VMQAEVAPLLFIQKQQNTNNQKAGITAFIFQDTVLRKVPGNRVFKM
jgi:hypothetical protein